MAGIARYQTLANFIRDCVTDKDKTDKDGKPDTVIAFSLVHTTGGVQQEVHTTKIAGAVDPTELASIFRNKAEYYGQEMPGIQNFVLLAFWAYSPKEPQARQPFTTSGKKNQYEAGESEPPTPQGEKQMSMRLHLATYEQMFKKQQVLDNYTLNIISHAHTRIRETEADNRDLMLIVKDMMMKQMTDNHELEMKKAQFERGTVERTKMLNMIPALTNTITGREVFPQSTADTSLINLIADSLDAEKVQKLIASGVISNELMGPLFSRLQQRENERAAEQEKIRRLNPPVKDPEKDAAGEVQDD